LPIIPPHFSHRRSIDCKSLNTLSLQIQPELIRRNLGRKFNLTRANKGLPVLQEETEVVVVNNQVLATEGSSGLC
jgi:hypothetical protein